MNVFTAPIVLSSFPSLASLSDLYGFQQRILLIEVGNVSESRTLLVDDGNFQDFYRYKPFKIDWPDKQTFWGTLITDDIILLCNVLLSLIHDSTVTIRGYEVSQLMISFFFNFSRQVAFYRRRPHFTIAGNYIFILPHII